MQKNLRIKEHAKRAALKFVGISNMAFDFNRISVLAFVLSKRFESLTIARKYFIAHNNKNLM